MTKQIEPIKQNETMGLPMPNQELAEGFTCTCDICSPSSWDRLSKHLDAEISRAERTRLSESVLPGGCFGPRVLKQRYEEIRELHKRGIFLGC